MRVAFDLASVQFRHAINVTVLKWRWRFKVRTASFSMSMDSSSDGVNQSLTSVMQGSAVNCL